MLDIQYLYWTSNMHIGLPIFISDFWYVYLTSYMYIGIPICISDFWYVYLTSHMYIGLPISILDIHMAFWLKRHPIISHPKICLKDNSRVSFCLYHLFPWQLWRLPFAPNGLDHLHVQQKKCVHMHFNGVNNDFNKTKHHKGMNTQSHESWHDMTSCVINNSEIDCTG